MNRLWVAFMLIPLAIVLMMISGCSKFQQEQLTCHPIKANGCIGWLSDKPIMLEQNL
jgi:hypothetical protein